MCPVPNTFSPNTKAKSSEVNANFDFFETLIDNQSGVGIITVNTANDDVKMDGALAIDNDGGSTGNLTKGLRFGGITSDEGITSKRTAGGNQYGLDFITGGSTVLELDNDGNIEFDGDYAIEFDANGNWLIYQGGLSGNIREIIVPTTGDANAALASIASGGVVTMLSGTHTVSSAIDMDHGSEVWLRGQGYGTILDVATGISGIIADNDRLVISDMTIDMDTDAAYGINVVSGANTCNIHNVRVIDVGENDKGISLGDDGAIAGAIVTGCHVYGTDAAGSYGIYVDNATGCIVNGCYVKDNASDIALTASSATCRVGMCATDIAVSDAGAGNVTTGNVVF